MNVLIPNLDAPLAARLQSSATAHGRTVEEEARQILHAALLDPAERETSGQNLAEAVHTLFAPLGGVDLDLAWMRTLPNKRSEPTFD